MIEVAAMAGVLALAQVGLRGGEGAPAGEMIAMDASGIVLGPPPGTLVIGWDRIKSVEGTWKDKAAPFLPGAEQAWRARSRLERGDPLSAEPLFETLFTEHAGKQGPTAAVVAEGLLRCRLRRGAHIAAIEPWLALLVATPASGTPVLHAAWASEAGLAPAIDPATGLVPALPPIWLAWPSVEALARQGANASVAGPRVDVLRAMYMASAKFECGQSVELTSVPSSDIGASIVREVVLSRVGDTEQRAMARKSLEERMRGSTANPTAPWLEAWCRAAIGRSLLREESVEVKKLGVVELLHIPARFAAMHPYLAGIALAEASVAMRGMGDKAGADILARELAELYPSHPVLEWPRFRSAAPPKAPSK